MTALAQFNDTLNLSNAPASGILAVYVDVTGSSLVSAVGLGFPEADISLSGSAEVGSSTCVGLNSDGVSCGGLLVEGMNVLDLPFQSSDGTVPFGMYFDAQDSCSAEISTLDGSVGSCIAASEYLDTAQIASIVVEDSNGNPVSGAFATSLSGVSYTLPEGAVPEPSSLMLLGTGLLCLAGAVRRKLAM